MGPFAVWDLSGLDISWRNRLRKAPARDPRERYVAIADRLCELGRLGRKAGKGWYDYAAGGAPRPAVGRSRPHHRRASAAARPAARTSTRRADPSPPARRHPQRGGLRARGRHCPRGADIDLVFVNGYGFSKFKGGPLFQAGRLARERHRADDRRGRGGDRLRLPPRRRWPASRDRIGFRDEHHPLSHPHRVRPGLARPAPRAARRRRGDAAIRRQRPWHRRERAPRTGRRTAAGGVAVVPRRAAEPDRGGGHGSQRRRTRPRARTASSPSAAARRSTLPRALRSSRPIPGRSRNMPRSSAASPGSHPQSRRWSRSRRPPEPARRSGGRRS